MLSRVADNLFWMARYFERAENTARLIDVNFNLMLDMGSVSNSGTLSEADAPSWNPIVRIASPYHAFRSAHAKTTPDSAIEWLAFGEGNPNSILKCIERARENARAIRGAISTEMWEQLNTVYLDWRGADLRRIAREGAHGFFRKVRNNSALFQGITDLTMPRDEAWNWIQIGKHLERADATARLLDVKYHILLPSLDEVGGPIDNVQWIAVLKSCSAYEAYQRSYVTRITPSRVAEFLVLNATFPRSTRFCFDQVYRGLHDVGVIHGEDGLGESETSANAARHTLESTTMTGIIQFGLHQYLLKLEDHANDISAKISATYFQGALRHAA